MNRESAKPSDPELEGRIPEGWRHLTEDDWVVLTGQFDELVKNLREGPVSDHERQDDAAAPEIRIEP